MADIKNMAMPKEVEELLNNKNKKESGSINVLKISGTKEAILYALDFLEENIKLYEKYFLHWTCWFEDEKEKYSFNEFLCFDRDFYSEKEQFQQMLENIDFKRGSCKKIFNNVYKYIRNCRECLRYDENMLKMNMEALEYELERIRAYVVYVYVYCVCSHLNPYSNEYQLYYHILNIPLYVGRRNIIEIVSMLCEELEECSFDFETINNESCNNNEENTNN